MAQPTYEIPPDVLASVFIDLDGTDYAGRIRDGVVAVAGAALAPTWAHPTPGGGALVTLGARVPSLLEELGDTDRGCVVCGGLIVSALVGHPRREPIGQPIRFVWTDHVALAALGDPSLAMKHSFVRDAQSPHVREIGPRLRLRGC